MFNTKHWKEDFNLIIEMHQNTLVTTQCEEDELGIKTDFAVRDLQQAIARGVVRSLPGDFKFSYNFFDRLRYQVNKLVFEGIRNTRSEYEVALDWTGGKKFSNRYRLLQAKLDRRISRLQRFIERNSK